MSVSWLLLVYENKRLCYSVEVSGAAELGRQKNETEQLHSQRLLSPDRCRVVIARPDETEVSRAHAFLEPLDEGRARLTNKSGKQPILLEDGSRLQARGCRELSLPAVFTLGSKTVRVQPEEEPDLEALPDNTVPPGQVPETSTHFFREVPQPAGFEMEPLLRWLQTTMGVLQSAASSRDFFPRAAQALIDIVGLDTGRVLVREKDGWSPSAFQEAQGSAAKAVRPHSRRILEKVCEEKKTYWHASGPASVDSASMAGLKTAVASPILNRQGEVIGVLYGERLQGPAAAPITRLVAEFVELIASGVAAGLARLEQEEAALAARVRLEQFFTPELARLLAEQATLMDGQVAEVTILFCDIRGFSRITERLGPAVTVEWINDVMSTLSDCVLAHEGVLVDCIGDELMAMWGAPTEQKDHAARACRAALDMLDQLPALSQRWEVQLQEAMDLGIGLNTGTARVGNTGSRRKLRYAPLGNTVNLASRVQGATKYLKCRLLLTGPTQAELGPEFVTRRLCSVRVVNIEQPVRLYELARSDRPGWPELKRQYEEALEEFERKNFRQSAKALAGLVALPVNDGPSLVLMSRAVNALVEEPDDFDPVWELSGK